MNDPDRLYALLPAVYRERDEAEGHPLRALLRLVSGQADLVREDVEQLWDDFFIETCRRWVIPYIGDLVGNNLLHDAHRLPGPDTARALFPDLTGRDLRPPIAVRTRADVAKTIYYRRRKGTLPMLEELARDVTGWPAHAVEFFERLGWTQYVRNHLRLERVGSLDVRRVEPLDRVQGPFDEAAHTVDVRRIGPLSGWYNVRNVGFFVWRLGSYPLRNVKARQAAAPWRFHVSPLGNPVPLFSRWRREGDEAGLATELHVPEPIRRAFFYEDLERYRHLPPPRPGATDLYGAFESTEGSFFIQRNGAPIAPAKDPNAPVVQPEDAPAPVELFEPQIVCRRLDPWPATQPAGQIIAVDVERGRIAVGSGWFDPTVSLDVSYHYGFAGDLGGGPYERGRWLVRPDLAALRLFVREGAIPPEAFPTLGAALAAWADHDRPDTIITILDSRSYEEPVAIELADGAWLALEAANGERPHLRPTGGAIEIAGNHPGSALTLSGLLIEGAVHVAGDLDRLRLLHATLVPGGRLDEDGQPVTMEPSLVAAGASDGAVINANLRVEIAFSITGPLRLPDHARGLWLLDSIVDGLGASAIAATGTADEPGPPGSLERVTVFGASSFKRLPLASETVFTGPVTVAQPEDGCVRFSFVPPGSATPRRHRCQPDLEIASQIEAAGARAQAENTTFTATERAAIRAEVRGWLAPSFTSRRYGQPGYGQLRLGCPAQIGTGAEDGSEMGAFSHLKQPQRETNLRIRLEEYLPFGLDAGLIYVT